MLEYPGRNDVIDTGEAEPDGITDFTFTQLLSPLVLQVSKLDSRVIQRRKPPPAGPNSSTILGEKFNLSHHAKKPTSLWDIPH